MTVRAFTRERQRRLAAERRRSVLRSRRARLAAGAVGAFALAAPATAAADFEVNTLSDAAADGCTTAPGGCTLRDAVTDANAAAGPDTITFASSLTGTLRLTQGEIPIQSADGSATTIDGPGAGAISISGDADDNGPDTGDSRIFNLLGGGAATISGLTLTEGYVPTSGGPFPSEGGAIQSDQGSPLTISDSVLSANTVAGSGGAVGGKYAGDVTVEDTTITGNTASSGEGGGINSPKYAEVRIADSTISGNTASGAGGGISAGGKYSPFQLTDSTVSGNTASTGAGVFFGKKYCASPPAPDCSQAGPSESEISNTTISGNHLATGGTGGGMAVGGLIAGDRLSVTHTTIFGNDGAAGSRGGGLGFTGTLGGAFELTDSTISGNLADVGAGISTPNGPVVAGGSVALDNSTIASNGAATTGGGIYLGSYDPGTGFTSARIPLDSTIVGNNTASGSAQDLDRANNSTGGGFDLAFSLVEAPGDAPFTQASSILGVDPRLNVIAGSGGPTQTMLPLTTSAAIDKGRANGLITDQRGFPRTIDGTGVPNTSDGTDIGSVELSNPPTAPAAKKKCKKVKKKGSKKRSAESSKKKKKKKCKKRKKKKKR